MTHLILDTETTGLNPKEGHRLCEIAVLGLLPNGSTYTAFHTRLNPERDLDPAAAAINGYSWDQLKDQPTFEQIAAPLLQTLINQDLVIHNAPFDVGFIDAELQRLNPLHGSLKALARRIHCTRALAKYHLPNQRHSLDALCDHYGIDRSHRAIHDAITDCQLLAKIFQRLGGQP